MTAFDQFGRLAFRGLLLGLLLLTLAVPAPLSAQDTPADPPSADAQDPSGAPSINLEQQQLQIQRDYDAQRIQGKTTSTGTTVFVENEADPGELPARDDRY